MNSEWNEVEGLSHEELKGLFEKRILEQTNYFKKILKDSMGEKTVAPKGKGKGKGKPLPKYGFQKIYQTSNYVEMRDKLYKEFKEHFLKQHKFIIPLSQEEVEKLSKEKKNELKVSLKTGLLEGACNAPGCHFFGKNRQKVNHHYDIWSQYPHGFHEFVKT